MIEFRFSHIDPDKLWRLLAKWRAGISWSVSDIREFRSLVKEWILYYLYLGNKVEAERLIKKKREILNAIEGGQGKCIKTTTPQGVKYVSKKLKSRQETCL